LLTRTTAAAAPAAAPAAALLPPCADTSYYTLGRERCIMVHQKGPCPDEATTGFFNKLTFSWINPVVKQAAKTAEVDLHHLPLPTQQTAEVAHDDFIKDWEAAVRAGNPNLRKTLWKTFGKDLMIAGIFKLVWSVW
jgi:hypothetical protein